MMRRSLPIALLLSGFLAACGPGEVVVTAEVEVRDPETGEMVLRPIANMPVEILPFDRDFIFDSLTAEAPRPEPEAPPELLVLRDSIFQAQQEHREAEAEWLATREQLEEISQEMEQYSTAEARYRELFDRFNDVEARMVAAENQRDSAFERMTRLQEEAFAGLEQIRFEIDTWEEEAFADYGMVVAARLQETRREIIADTTDATGRAQFRSQPGEWWVHARHRLPMEELYWNIRVNVERGEPSEIRLTRETAEVREAF